MISPDRPPLGSETDHDGITMIELVVVLAIVSLIVLVAFPNLRSRPDAVVLKAFSSELVGRLRSARATAIAEGRDVEFVLDSKGHSYGLSNSPANQQIPDGVSVEITTAKHLIRTGDSARMVFFADGSSTGGAVTLTMDHHVSRIRIDWLTGAVRQSQVAP